jgi:hypothetical protein
MATAPGFCRCFPDSLAARAVLKDQQKRTRYTFIDGIPDALKDQQKMAPVDHVTPADSLAL